jgi:hypothetical protein
VRRPGRRTAAISWNCAREEDWRLFLSALMRPNRESDKRELGTWAMRKSIGGLGAQNVLAKKRGSIRRWSPMKVVANGRGRRKRRLPMDLTEGGGFGSIRVGDLRDRGRRMRCGVSSTSRICGRPAFSAMRLLVCQPCALCREWSACLTHLPRHLPQRPDATLKNNKALLEGRAGPKFEGSQGFPQGGDESERGGRNARRRRPGYRAASPLHST